MAVAILFVASFDKPEDIRGKAILARAIFLIGWIGCGGTFLLFLLGKPLPHDFQLPMGSAGGFAVSAEGRIFLGLTPVSRLQVYDREGRFIESRYIEVGDAGVRLSVDKEGLLHVYTTKGRHHYIYNKRGQKIAAKRFDREAPANPYQTRDRQGNLYTLQNFVVYQRVVKSSTNGTTRTIIAEPIYLWPFCAIWRLWLLAIGGGILMERFAKQAKRTRKRRTA
jgi:hypothetical protein